MKILLQLATIVELIKSVSQATVNGFISTGTTQIYFTIAVLTKRCEGRIKASLSPVCLSWH